MALKEGEIAVSKKTLLHISEGIYRTEGSSIKELISNAFDANASKVVINTNYPLFDILTCQDNGDGMTEEEFLRIVNGGIGDSKKATATTQARPIIGKLGIGILAIAQICRSFTIISHHEKSKSAFKGRMIFRTDVDKVAKTQSIKATKEDANYEIGTWVVEEEIAYDEKKKGVLVFTKDLRQTFVKRFREDRTVQSSPRNSAPLNFESLLAQFYNADHRAVKELGPYYELIWELCHLCPLPYYKGSPIREEYVNKINHVIDKEKGLLDGEKFILAKQSELLHYDFSVVFDDINLFRPICLPFPVKRLNHYQASQLFYYHYSNQVRKRDLEFHVYCIAQESAILPRDLKGIQIRIKNVGIGLNDATFLKYERIESPRDNWVFGEVYVEKGLESALNIDRDSFNENDEHYFVLKKEVHNFLASVFSAVSSSQRKRNEVLRKKKVKKYAESMRVELERFFASSLGFKVDFSSEVDDEKIIFNARKKMVTISESVLTGSFAKRRLYFGNSLLDLIYALKGKKDDDDFVGVSLNEFSKILLS